MLRPACLRLMTRGQPCSKVGLGPPSRGPTGQELLAMVTIRAGPLADFVRDIFIEAGSSAAEGERIGKYLVAANLAGHDSHGVVRVPRYLQWQREGAVVCDRKVEIKTETPVLAVVDG